MLADHNYIGECIDCCYVTTNPAIYTASDNYLKLQQCALAATDACLEP